MVGRRQKRSKSKASKTADAGFGDMVFIETLAIPSLGGAATDDVEAAQEIMWDAWDAGTRKRRIALANKALAISPLCADAYVLLAQEAAHKPHEAVDFYRKGVEAGEEALGQRPFREDVGDFWLIIETRPYMRARQGLAMAQWKLGQREEAVTHYRDMLRLNPNDNQGIRYILLDCLLELGLDDDAAKLLKRYKDDGSAHWAWAGALSLFRRGGDNAVSRKALARAAKTNKHVAAYLIGRKKLPRALPAFISMGGEDEAVAYVHDSAVPWIATPGALTWLAGALPA